MTLRTPASLLLVFSLGLLVGCKGERKADEAANPVPQINEVEVQRGRDACEHFKARICECGEKTKDAELLRQCGLADVRMEAFELALKALRGSREMAPQERQAAGSAVRKVVKGCIEETAAVDVTCPRGP